VALCKVTRGRNERDCIVSRCQQRAAAVSLRTDGCWLLPGDDTRIVQHYHPVDAAGVFQNLLEISQLHRKHDVSDFDADPIWRRICFENVLAKIAYRVGRGRV
jgi:hypothetical protein